MAEIANVTYVFMFNFLIKKLTFYPLFYFKLIILFIFWHILVAAGCISMPRQLI